MRSFKVNRPNPEHIEKMVARAKEVNKKQIEVLGMNEDMLTRIETTHHHKHTLAYKKVQGLYKK